MTESGVWIKYFSRGQRVRLSARPGEVDPIFTMLPYPKHGMLQRNYDIDPTKCPGVSGLTQSGGGVAEAAAAAAHAQAQAQT